MNRLALRVCLAVSVLFAGPASFAGVNSFTVSGPDGGAITAVAVQPGQPNTVLASTYRSIHRSTDGGLHWTRSAHTTYSTGEIAFDQIDTSRVYILSGQIQVSTDSGQTFAAATHYTDLLNRMTVSGSRLYATDGYGVLHRSNDGARTWTTLTVPWPTTRDAYRIYGLAAAPTNPDVVYICVMLPDSTGSNVLAGSGTYKTIDAGATWTGPIANSPCSTRFTYSRDMVVSPADADRVISGTSDGTLLSTDGGATWTNVFPYPFMASLAFDPAAPSNVLGFDTLGLIYRSYDAGATWPFPSRGADLMQYNVAGGAFTGGTAGRLFVAASDGPLYSADNGSTFERRFTGIRSPDIRQLVAANDGTLYAMYFHPAGIHKRVNGAWTAADNDELQSTFNSNFNLMDVAVAPQDSSRLYVADQSWGLFHSTNGGDDWLPQSASIQTQVFGIDVDPTNPTRAYAQLATGGVMVTSDGGYTFTNCAGGSVPFDHVYIDAASPNILYALGSYGQYRRVYKSTNSCASWTPITPVFPVELHSLSIDPLDHQKIYVAHSSGIDRSEDGGSTWSPLTFDFNNGILWYARGLLIDPVFTDTIWAYDSTGGGFARSVDGGATWRETLLPREGLRNLLRFAVLDPLHPDTLVAAADGLGMVDYQVATDLALTLSGVAGPMAGGTADSAVFTIRNHGPHAASPSSLRITLPAWLDATTPVGCTRAAQVLTCVVSALQVDAERTVTLPLTASTSGAGDLTANLTTHEVDTDGSDNQISQRVVAPPAGDVSVVLAESADPVSVGGTLRYTATVRRVSGTLGPSSLVVNFTGTTVTAVTTSEGSCSNTSSSVTCTVDPGDTTTVTMTADTAAAGIITASANVTHPGVDPELDNNASSIGSTVVLTADLNVSMTRSTNAVTTGTAFNYVASIQNQGPNAGSVQVSIPVTGATVTAATPSVGTCTHTASQVNCDIATLAVGASATIRVDVNAAATGTARAVATATFAGADPVVSNDSVTNEITVSSPTPAPPAGGASGGGGGGRLDWWLLIAVGLLAAGRQRAFSRVR